MKIKMPVLTKYHSRVLPIHRLGISLAFALILVSQLASGQTAIQNPPSTVDPDNKPVTAVAGPKQEPTPFVWKPLEQPLPKSLKVYEGTSINCDGQPVHAWYAKLSRKHKDLAVKSVQSNSQYKRDLTSTLAQKSNAIVAVNSGYFAIKELPSRSASIVISEGKLIGLPRPTATRNDVIFPVLYSAFGVKKDGKYEFAWVAPIEGKAYAYPSPLPNSDSIVSPPHSRTFPSGGHVWDVQEGAGGGPMLARNGAFCVTDTEEKFAASHSAIRHPRTAVGATANGELILFVVDGRQPKHSMGMSIAELAMAMMDLGCQNAVNLDGGGSSAFVVNGKTINKPSDGVERSVTDILALVPAALEVTK